MFVQWSYNMFQYLSFIDRICDAKAGTDCSLPIWPPACLPHSPRVCVILTELFCCHVMTRKYARLRLALTLYRLSKYLIILLIFLLLSEICFDTSIRQHFELNCMCCEYVFICWKPAQFIRDIFLYSLFFFNIRTIGRDKYLCISIALFPTTNTDNNVKFLLLCIFIQFKHHFYFFILILFDKW